MAEETTSEEVAAWAQHPYTVKLVKAQKGEVQTLERSLMNASLGSSDPTIVRIGTNLVNAKQYLLVLEGKK